MMHRFVRTTGVMLGLLTLLPILASAATPQAGAPSPLDPPPSTFNPPASPAIPWVEIGAAAGKDYKGG